MRTELIGGYKRTNAHALCGTSLQCGYKTGWKAAAYPASSSRLEGLIRTDTKQVQARSITAAPHCKQTEPSIIAEATLLYSWAPNIRVV